MVQANVHIDRDRLRSNLLAKQYVLEVDLDHLIAYNEELANRIRETPAEVMPLVRTRCVLLLQASRAEKTRLCAAWLGCHLSSDSSKLLYEDVQSRF